jgi:hypothetical protein
MVKGHREKENPNEQQDSKNTKKLERTSEQKYESTKVRTNYER